MSEIKELKGYRASLLHFPAKTDSPETDFIFISDGLLVTHNGKVVDIGDYQQLNATYSQQLQSLTDYSGKLIVPGLIDSHLHFPQTEMIASYGEQLLEWLQNYTFPTESKFDDEDYAYLMAELFVQQLLSNGTTSAMVFSSVHPTAAECLFRVAEKYQMKLIIGKVCMDRNCPDELRDTADTAKLDSAQLIEKWHGRGRAHYAITPRFAPTSSHAQMYALGELAQQYPDVFIQTHLSENKHEIEWVKQLYPEFDSYLAVYDHFNLVRERSVFGHCLHLSEDEWALFKDRKASIAFCPSSNMFLGSGLFDLQQAKNHQIPIALASDVGAGTSFNMLRIMGEAYKVCQLKGTQMSPLEGLYMMTQGAAIALNLESQIGNLNPGSDADFVVLDPRSTPISHLRTQDCLFEQSICAPSEVIFALSMLADDRTIHATYVAGNSSIMRTKEKE